MFKIIAFFIITLFPKLYVTGQLFTHMWKALAWPWYLTKKGCLGSFLRFWYFILKIFWQCGIFRFFILLPIQDPIQLININKKEYCKLTMLYFFLFNMREAQPVWRTKSYNFKRVAWEGNVLFFKAFFLIIWLELSLFDLWLFRSFYQRRSSVESFVERDFLIIILFRFCIE